MGGIAILGYVLAWRVLGAQASHHAVSWTHLDIIHLWALDNVIYLQEMQLYENYALPLHRGGGVNYVRHGSMFVVNEP